GRALRHNGVKMIDHMPELVSEVVKMLLKGEDSVLKVLREQLRTSKWQTPKLSGSGFSRPFRKVVPWRSAKHWRSGSWKGISRCGPHDQSSRMARRSPFTCGTMNLACLQNATSENGCEFAEPGRRRLWRRDRRVVAWDLQVEVPTATFAWRPAGCLAGRVRLPITFAIRVRFDASGSEREPGRGIS